MKLPSILSNDWSLKVVENICVIRIDTPFVDGFYTGGAGAFDSLDESALYYVNEGKFALLLTVW